MFREDLRTDSLASRKWLCLLFVQNAKGDKVNILDNYMRLSAVDTKDSCRTRPPSLAVLAMNLCIALCQSLGSSAKAKMLSTKNSIGTDKPTLLWKLLKTYQGTTAQVIQSAMKRLDKLQDTLKGFKFNIDKFCDYSLKTLTRLMDTGGDDSQAFEKIYEALKSTPNSEFSNVLVV